MKTPCKSRAVQTRYAISLSLLTAFLLVISSTIIAQDNDPLSEAKRLKEAGSAYQDSGKYDSSIIAFNHAAHLFQQAGDQIEYIKSKIEEGKSLHEDLKYDSAFTVFQDLLGEAKAILGDDHLEVGHIYDAIGKIHSALGRYAEALESFESGLLRKGDTEDLAADQGVSYGLIGDMRRSLGQIEDAMSAYERSLELLGKAYGEKSVEVARVLSNIAIVHRMKGDSKTALDRYLEAEQIVLDKDGEEAEALSPIYNGIGIIHAQNGQFPQALNYFNRLLELDQLYLSPLDPNLARTHTNLGILHEMMGDYNKAMELHENALSIKLQTLGNTHPSLTNDYLGLAVIYNLVADVDQALVYLQRAIQLEKDLVGEGSAVLGNAYNLMGGIYNRKKDFDNAMYYLRLAEKAFTPGGEIMREAGPVYHNIASAQIEIQDYQAALQSATKALEVNMSAYGERHPFVAGNRVLIGRIYQLLKEPALARSEYEQGVEINLEAYGSRHPEVAMAYSNLAGVLQSEGELEESMETIQKALIASCLTFKDSDIRSNPQVSDAINTRNLGIIMGSKGSILREYYQQSGDTHHLANANSALLAAIDLIEEAQFSYKAKGSVNTLREDAYPIFEQALWVTYELFEQTGSSEHLEQALAIAERNKATLLVAALNESRATEFAGIPTTELNLENQLKRDLTFYEQKIADLRQLRASDEAINEVQSTLFDLKTQYDSLITTFEENYPDYYALKFNRKVIGLEEIRENILDAQDLLIEYHLGDEHLYTIAVDRKSVLFTRNPVDTDLLSEIQLIRDKLTSRPDDNDNFNEVSHGLYKTLLEPVEKILAGKNLLIIPDDVIGLVPFEVLAKAEGRTNYLITDHCVTYGYSATFLSQALTASNGHSHQFLAFAPDFSDRSDEAQAIASVGRDGTSNGLLPLLGAKEEVEALSSAFQGDFREGSSALESDFKQQASNYGIIHLATHAIIDNVNPMNSRLLFTRTGDSLEDGNLHAWELLGMKLNAQLAVLSACNTGTGKIQKGEGVLSLGRAFAYAGCPSNLMSLWPAQDASTAKIMKAFYRNLSAGMRKDQALRSAKLDYLLQSEDFVRHPYYWAGFILQGDSRPLALPKKPYFSVIILSAVALIVLGYWVMKKPGSLS